MGFEEVSEWEQFDREERSWRGRKFFFERYVHKPSKSGCIIFSTVNDRGEVIYVVEGYGIGTIDPKDFTECASFAPIQRSVHESEEEAREALRALMTENLLLWKKYSADQKKS